MRPLILCVLLVGLLAGCSGPGGLGDPSPVVDAPELARGLLLAYSAAGSSNANSQYSIVIDHLFLSPNDRSPSGYVFAGRVEQDLIGAAAFPADHEWYGGFSLALESTPEEMRPLRLFDFPLRDGKRWSYDTGFTVEAKAADLDVLGRSEPGFWIEGSAGAFRSRWSYAPSVGFFTSFEVWEGDDKRHDLKLRSIGTSPIITWYDAVGRPVHMSGSVSQTQVLEVPAGADDVAFYAWGTVGTTVRVVPVGSQEAWSHTFASNKAVERSFPAEPGSWAVVTQVPPGGLVEAHAVPVQWLVIED